MPLYIVLHHQKDANQPWVNAWLSDDLIHAIQTTNDIGELCRSAKSRNERVFVHRCRWGESAPIVCCSVDVDTIEPIDKRTVLVTFTGPSIQDCDPPRQPVRGQNFYLA